ncbi:hypothetical protein BJ684DRAFT_17019 [Piptocephalis cylindrospora]|uniref:Uncharacterized protein n=1 Tax=Piptocephalis cylindrospora TaxID=1907219 RepID=A0A4P9Y152_9FUNG|nr:hypothetical protein BJ684DRAFT_17019 [Piptocephalis cylindrospora]|eukprot:RKP12498.1 hypothetical protein BJ684DRAFT_17019 [Piptocephalis cylindrospora]
MGREKERKERKEKEGKEKVEKEKKKMEVDEKEVVEEETMEIGEGMEGAKERTNVEMDKGAESIGKEERMSSKRDAEEQLTQLMAEGEDGSKRARKEEEEVKRGVKRDAEEKAEELMSGEEEGSKKPRKYEGIGMSTDEGLGAPESRQHRRRSSRRLSDAVTGFLGKKKGAGVKEEEVVEEKAEDVGEEEEGEGEGEEERRKTRSQRRR